MSIFTQNAIITLRKNEPFIVQIEVNFSKHSHSEQTHQPVTMVVWSVTFVSHNCNINDNA